MKQSGHVFFSVRALFLSSDFQNMQFDFQNMQNLHLRGIFAWKFGMFFLNLQQSSETKKPKIIT